MGFLKTICDKQQNAKYRNFDTFGFFWVITMKKAKTKKTTKGIISQTPAPAWDAVGMTMTQEADE